MFRLSWPITDRGARRLKRLSVTTERARTASQVFRNRPRGTRLMLGSARKRIVAAEPCEPFMHENAMTTRSRDGARTD
jgi:hypothetical protein